MCHTLHTTMPHPASYTPCMSHPASYTPPPQWHGLTNITDGLGPCGAPHTTYNHVTPSLIDTATLPVQAQTRGFHRAGRASICPPARARGHLLRWIEHIGQPRSVAPAWRLAPTQSFFAPPSAVGGGQQGQVHGRTPHSHAFLPRCSAPRPTLLEIGFYSTQS